MKKVTAIGGDFFQTVKKRVIARGQSPRGNPVTF